MEDRETTQGHYPLNYIPREQALAEFKSRIKEYERKYGIHSAEMRKLHFNGDEKWETLEILRWMSADVSYHRLIRDDDDLQLSFGSHGSGGKFWFSAPHGDRWSESGRVILACEDNLVVHQCCIGG